VGGVGFGAYGPTAEELQQVAMDISMTSVADSGTPVLAAMQTHQEDTLIWGCGGDGYAHGGVLGSW
jgi:hypothetical protein